MTPQITTEYNMDTEQYRLMVTSYSKTEPAGDRLFRGGDIPAILFVHDLEADAERDRAKLQKYVDETHGKKISKSRSRGRYL